MFELKIREMHKSKVILKIPPKLQKSEAEAFEFSYG